VHRVLRDGDLVVNHSLITGDGGPVGVRFDLWQLADGRVLEHWGDVEPWAATTASENTQIDGPATPDATADRDLTRSVAVAAVETILVDGDAGALGDHLAGEDYIQHNPRFANGVSGLVAALTALAEQGITMKYDGIRQVVVDGDFAYLRSGGTFGGAPYVFHDLFRVAGGRCVEHWDVMVERA
jgi:predicted SnoaL-like aldol condensation-catalyzing enzyme